jgi:hypothetical protein
MYTGKFLRKLSYGHTWLVLLRRGMNLGTNCFYLGQLRGATTVSVSHSVKFFRMCSIVGELITCAPAEPYEGGCKWVSTKVKIYILNSCIAIRGLCSLLNIRTLVWSADIIRKNWVHMLHFIFENHITTFGPCWKVCMWDYSGDPNQIHITLIYLFILHVHF